MEEQKCEQDIEHDISKNDNNINLSI